MSRARTRKQEEKVDFLTQNPDLIEYDVNLSVTKDDENEYVIEGKDGLGNPIPVPSYQGITFPNEISLADQQLLPDGGQLTASAPGIVQPGEYGISFVTLSKDGIGVFGEDEDIVVGGNQIVGNGIDVPDEARSIDEGEILQFDLGFGIAPAVATLNGGPPGFGLTDLLIEYEVLNDGAGTITLEFDSAPPLVYVSNGLSAPTPPEVVDIAAGSENSTGVFEVDAPPGMPFGGWELTVEGDVMVAVTGISYSTTTDGMIAI